MHEKPWYFLFSPSFFPYLLINFHESLQFPIQENNWKCKQYNRAVANTLMTVSKGLGLFSFCKKMEKTRPRRDEMVGMVFISLQS